MNIEQRVFQIVSELLDCEESSITSSTKLMNLEMDSHDYIDFIMDLESEFNIRIDDENCRTFNTMGDVIDYVTKVVK